MHPLNNPRDDTNRRSLSLPTGGLLANVPAESVWLANFPSPRTRRTYRNAVSEFIAFHGITTEDGLRSVSQAHVIAWREALAAAGATPRTINNRLSAVSSLFKHLCEHQLASRNPATGVKRPRVNQAQVVSPALTPHQVRRMLDTPDTSTLKGLRDSAILHILFFTGCRISEVCHLTVGDLFEDSGYFVLEFTVKGGKRLRVAINQELQIVLRRYLAMAGHGLERNAPLLLPVQRASRRKPLNTRQINNIFHEYARLANAPDSVRPHSARATFITQALERKCPIEAVQRTVGHSKIATTQMYDKRHLNHRESASFAVSY